MTKFGAVTEQSTTALRVPVLIPAHKIYLYGLHIVVSGLSGLCVCVYRLFGCKRTHGTGYIPRVGSF